MRPGTMDDERPHPTAIYALTLDFACLILTHHRRETETYRLRNILLLSFFAIRGASLEGRCNSLDKVDEVFHAVHGRRVFQR